MGNTYSCIRLEGSDLIQYCIQKLDLARGTHRIQRVLLCTPTEPPEYHTTRPHRPAPPACARARARASEQQRLPAHILIHILLLVAVMWWSVTPHCATFTPFAALHPQDGMSPGIQLYSHVFTPGPQILYNTVFSWLPLCILHLGLWLNAKRRQLRW